MTTVLNNAQLVPTCALTYSFGLSYSTGLRHTRHTRHAHTPEPAGTQPSRPSLIQHVRTAQRYGGLTKRTKRMFQATQVTGQRPLLTVTCRTTVNDRYMTGHPHRRSRAEPCWPGATVFAVFTGVVHWGVLGGAGWCRVVGAGWSRVEPGGAGWSRRRCGGHSPAVLCGLKQPQPAPAAPSLAREHGDNGQADNTPYSDAPRPTATRHALQRLAARDLELPRLPWPAHVKRDRRRRRSCHRTDSRPRTKVETNTLSKRTPEAPRPPATPPARKPPARLVSRARARADSSCL